MKTVAYLLGILAAFYIGYVTAGLNHKPAAQIPSMAATVPQKEESVNPATTTATDPAAAVPNQAAPVAEAPVSVNEDDSSARHAEVTVKQIVQGGGIVSGGFYDWAPGSKIPQDPGPQPGEQIHVAPIQQKWESLNNPCFIAGLPPNLYDGVEWTGMIKPNGVFHYSTALGERTIPSYVVSNAKDPVESFWAANRARKLSSSR